MKKMREIAALPAFIATGACVVSIAVLAVVALVTHGIASRISGHE